MMTTKPVYIVAAKRTPIGKAPRGQLAGVRPDTLLAHVIKSVMADLPSVDPARIHDVIVGCAMPEGEQGMNVARIASLLAGLPDNVPGITINRFCSSGLQSIAYAAQLIESGSADLVLAGGTESMSQVPLGGNRLSMNPAVFEKEESVAIAYGMGITAEIVAQQFQVSREAQDAFAFESHQRALHAQAEGLFLSAIAPFQYERATPNLSTGEIVHTQVNIQNDEGPRADTSLEKLAALRSAFSVKGSVTAGNSSQMSDGAAVLMLASESAIKEFNLLPLARFVDFQVCGVPPEIMGIGPVKAIPTVLEKAQLKLSDLDWIELNEAFSAQSLAVIAQLNLDREKVNPYGGAIAMGHPLGATGAIRSTLMIHAMREAGLRYGMVSMCIGTGMGAAGIFEAL